VGRIENNNVQKEYYLTDIMEIARQDGHKVSAFVVGNEAEVMGINTPEDLAYACRLMERAQL
jgi:bifunctional N-acetylglucosamine-1-phosphate-uridyltransferase/glucosamine-1-phosphate-acetyltransferase GlmU-like protein